MDGVFETWAILMDACRSCPQDAHVLMIGFSAVVIFGPWVVAGVIACVS